MNQWLNRLAGSLCRVETTEPVFHVTFDDGPDPEVTLRVLDLLSASRAAATFFLLVDHAGRYPDLAREIRRQGHDVGLHGRSHRSVASSSWTETIDEVARARTDLEHILGCPVALFRPPYGVHGVRSLLVARMAGLETVLWSMDTCDWQGVRDEAEFGGNVESARPGGIGLMHDTTIGGSLREEVARGLIPRDMLVGMLLERLAAARLQAVSIGKLVAAGTEVHRFRPLPSSPSGSADYGGVGTD